MSLLQPFKIIGYSVHLFVRESGRMGCFLFTSLFLIFTPPVLFDRTIKQIYFIGVRTLPLIILTGLFTGMVIAIEVFNELTAFGAEGQLGNVIAMSLIRELGPVIAALMVTARAGSALAAEIGVMRITEQIDALEAMALNPYKYLVIPNLLAGVICLPILNAVFCTVGIWGGFLVVHHLHDIAGGTYFGAVGDSISVKDLLLTFYKSLSFGLIISWVCCYRGFNVGYGYYEGAQGVGRATTRAVVLSSVIILIWDYFLTSLFM